jgi:hypothetical protein
MLQAQQISYFNIDSLSYHQYINADWNGVLNTAKMAEAEKIVYPNLMLRAGYAALIKERHSLSLKYYSKALKLNSYNETALYYAAYNSIQLSRSDAAVFLLKNLSAEACQLLQLNSKRSIESVDGEISFKPNNATYRETGKYFRLRISNRMNYRWKMNYCVATYRQNFLENISPPPQPGGKPPPPPTLRTFLVNDFQLYLKSEYYFNARLAMFNAIHIASTNFDNSNYKTAIISSGIKYLLPSADIKMEINAGPLLDSLITQVAVSSTYFPLGNLRFYGNSRVSFQQRTNLAQLNYYQMFGFKLHRKAWFEMHATFGEIKNLIDNEALYIYYALDPGSYRLGCSLLLPLTNHFTLNTNYFFEQKKLYLQNTNYQLHSLTLGLTWKI